MSHQPSLQASTTLEYLGEGAANVVYRICNDPSRSSTASDSGFAAIVGHIESRPSDLDFINNSSVSEKRVLRLRKALPSAIPNVIADRGYHEIIKPLLPPEYLCANELVTLDRKTIEACNSQLRRDEASGKRPSRRHGVYLAENEPQGLVLPDMSPDVSVGERLIEFKPKWLAQSPCAPPDAKRCRTCALRVQRNRARRLKGEMPEVSFCPLDFVSKRKNRVHIAVHDLVAKHNLPPQESERLQRRLVRLLHKNPLLGKLQQLQGDLDKDGVLNTDVSSQSFLIATTLRDCSIYLKVKPQH